MCQALFKIQILLQAGAENNGAGFLPQKTKGVRPMQIAKRGGVLVPRGENAFAKMRGFLPDRCFSLQSFLPNTGKNTYKKCVFPLDREEIPCYFRINLLGR